MRQTLMVTVQTLRTFMWHIWPTTHTLLYYSLSKGWRKRRLEEEKAQGGEG